MFSRSSLRTGDATWNLTTPAESVCICAIDHHAGFILGFGGGGIFRENEISFRGCFPL